jgi:hypothetical protein
MATVGVSLAVVPGTGVGAPSSTANMAGPKSVLVSGVFTGQVIVEAAAVVGGVFCQIATFTAPVSKLVEVACAQMRVRSQNVGGVPVVDITAEGGVVESAVLVAPAGNGAGAAVDISTLGEFTTAMVSAGFTGTVVVELSEDGVNWVQGFPTFTGVGGCESKVTPANFARVRRAGATGGPIPTVNLAAVDVASGNIHARARVNADAVAPTLLIAYRIAALLRLDVGSYRLTLLDPIPITDRFITPTIIDGAGIVQLDPATETTTIIEILVFTNAGAPADFDFDVLVERVS